jgi:hypothetical protein
MSTQHGKPGTGAYFEFKVDDAVQRVQALVEKWENATELSSGQPSIVARAFAAELREALEGK